MLIHKATNFYAVDFFESYYNKIFYSKITQTSISEALIYNNLREENKFFLEEEFNRPVKRDYLGGYVKPPTKKIVNAMAGIDYSGLYPNSMITCGISPERKVDSINVENGYPLTIKDELTWKKYAENGNYILAPTGRIYDNTTDGIFVKIEKKLINERSIFKGHKNELYLDLIPKLEELIKSKEN
jgi:DNA polymerase elongation subunit (family B)